MNCTQTEASNQPTPSDPVSEGAWRARHAAKTQVSASPVRKTARFAGWILTSCVLLLMAVMLFFLLQSLIVGGDPTVAGYQLYTVLGGSMSPAFEAGSIVLVRPLDAGVVQVGDVITYRKPDSGAEDRITTHRVMAVNPTEPPSFITRGDANDADDPLPVTAGSLIGRVDYSVPYLGYLLSFVKTRTGLLLLVVLPAVLIILSELRKLWGYLHALEEEKRLKGVKPIG